MTTADRAPKEVADGHVITRVAQPAYPRPERRTDVSELLTIDEVAAYLRLPKATLYNWHHRGEGPLPFKLGKHLRYRASEVEAWLEAKREPRPA